MKFGYETVWKSQMADTGSCCCRYLHRKTENHRLGAITEQTTLIPSSRQGSNILPRKDYESLDYDRCYNKPYKEHLDKQTHEHSINKIEVIKWVITCLIGVCTGLVAFFIDTIVKLLSKSKLLLVDESIKSCLTGACLLLPLIILVLFNATYVLIASCLTAYEPVAAGSGIPEIKCYLNGVKIPRVVRLQSFIAKAVGVLFSVAGGLFVGKEGPMIHSGAIIGAGIPQFQSITFKKVKSKYDFFRSDRDKRDFVSGGAAAGVAAAFGAPIGGVLFSLEEGCSFWNQKLTWRTFFCSMSATFTLNFFLSGLRSNSWGYFYTPGLINFGVFKCTPDELTNGACKLWNAIDLLIFIVMGFFGGLLGAFFNFINKYLTIYRMKYVHTKHKAVRIFEAILVAVITTTVAFLASMWLGSCRQKYEGISNITDHTPVPSNTDSVTVDDGVRTYFCDKGRYNDMATLFFNSQEEAIKQLFHQEGTFSLKTLGLFFIFFFLLACWTYGVSVPSGLFVPSLLCGAAYGRFVSTLLRDVFGYDHHIYSGTFSLIGAAAFLGGVVRMTISLTVILIESTNEISYGLPLMIVLMVAKWSGDLFNEGLYDIHIDLKGVPLLEWDVSRGMEKLKAKDIMNSDLVFIFAQTRVSVIQRILKTTAHNAFPVVRLIERENFGASGIESQEHEMDPTSLKSTGRILTFEGLILRSQLVVLLKNQIFFQDDEQNSQQPNLTYEEMTCDYPRYPDIIDITNNQIYDSRYILDVTSYMNTTPYTVYPQTPVPQVFHLFRSMGLRHVPVVDHDGQIQGIITRHNLTHEHLEEKLQEVNEMEGLHTISRH